MTTAAKYLLRKPSATLEAEPERLTEIDALRVVVSATGGAACAMCEVAPLAAHLAGPVAGISPEGHGSFSDLRSPGSSRRRASALRDLIVSTCGPATAGPAVPCTCQDRSRHPLAVMLRHLSPGRVIRVPHNNTSSQESLERAFRSGDVDRFTHAFEPRLDALKILVDRARAEYGGDLPELVIEAAVLLLRSLAGPTRWDVRGGWEMVDWPLDFRAGAAFEKAQSVMVQDFIFDRILIRLVEGR